MNVHWTDKIGFGRMVVLGTRFSGTSTHLLTPLRCAGALLQVVTYCIQAAAPPFPLFVLSFIFTGFGIAIQVCYG
jgi:hypothetical protein